MRTRIISSLAVATLVLSACGGSGGKQGEVADLLVESASEEGLELDEGCVDDLAGQLSDEDAEKMIEAGVDGEADISPEAQALAFEMITCIDTDSLVDTMIAELGDEVDADCMRDVLEDVDPAALANGDLPEGIFACMDLGG